MNEKEMENKIKWLRKEMNIAIRENNLMFYDRMHSLALELNDKLYKMKDGNEREKIDQFQEITNSNTVYSSLNLEYIPTLSRFSCSTGSTKISKIKINESRNNFTGLSKSCYINSDSYVIIFDTNIFMHNLEMFNDATCSSKDSDIIIIVPTTVIDELKHLKVYKINKPFKD